MKKSIVAGFVIFVSGLAVFRMASAHAAPVSYEPESGAILESAPERTLIRFSERVEPKASGIAVFGPNGIRVDDGQPLIHPEDARSFSVAVAEAGEGVYTVSWQVVSADDGHFTKGAFYFSVGGETGTPGAGQIQIQHITTLPQAAVLGLELIGQSLLFGALAVFLLIARPIFKKFGVSAPAGFEKRFSAVFAAGAILVAAGAISLIIVKTFDLIQLRPGGFGETFRVLLSTADGRFALYRASLGALAAAVFFLFRKSFLRSGRFAAVPPILLAAVLLMIFFRTVVSHAAASSFYPALSVAVNFLHLAFKEFWIGGIAVMAAVFVPSFRRAGPLTQRFFLISFSKIVSIAFLGAAATGVYVVWLHLKDPRFLFSTEWGSRLIILSIFGAALFAVRIWHQFFAERRAVELEEKGERLEKSGIVRSARFTLPFEVLAGAGLLFVTGLIIITTPPYAGDRYVFQKQAESEGALIALSVHPYEKDHLLIAISSLRKGSNDFPGNPVITVTNSAAGIGPIVAETRKKFEGGFVFPGKILSPPGLWRVDISAEQPGAYDAAASFSVDYPGEVEASRLQADKRSFGFFEIVLTAAALFAVFLGIVFFRFSKKLEARLGESVKEQLKFREEGPGPAGAPRVRSRRPVSWIPGLVAFAAFLAAVWLLNDQFIKSGFQKLCEENRHFWIQSAPVSDGRALSSDTVTGCFLDAGLYHFADRREYEYFFRRQEIIAELDFLQSNPRAGEPTDFTISLSEIRDGRLAGPARDLGVYHDRIMHAIIVSEDLTVFAHIHPEDLGPVTEEMKAEAKFPFRYTFPKAGRYSVNVDFTAGGREISRSFIVNAAGGPEMQKAVLVPENGESVRQFGDYRVTLASPRKIKSGERVKLGYYIQKNGAPVKNLEPYLAAAMHVAIIRDDLARFTHTHGEAFMFGSVWFQQVLGKYYKYHLHFAPDSFGPRVITRPWTTIFPSPGVYRVFGEFKHESKVTLTDFALQVE